MQLSLIAFILGAVVVDILQIFSTVVAFEPIAVNVGLWTYPNVTTEYYNVPLTNIFTWMALSSAYSLAYHWRLKYIKLSSDSKQIAWFRYLGPLLTAVASLIFLCLMWIVYGFIAGIKCVLSFIPTQRPDSHQNLLQNTLQLFLLSGAFFTDAVLVFYYSRYYRLTNKFSFGRLLLPFCLLVYYTIFISFLLLERAGFLEKRPILLGTILTAVTFQMFIHALPFLRDVVARVQGEILLNFIGERVLFEDPLLFFSTPGKEWSAEDANGSMRSFDGLLRDVDVMSRRQTQLPGPDIAGDI